MINYNNIISNKISMITKIDSKELENYIEIPPQSEMGDFAFPCFRLAKQLKKSPVVIAKEIREQIKPDEYIEQVEEKSGYLNFYINKTKFVEEVLKEIDKQKENYGKSDIGNEKNIIVEYSSPNIAKPFHVGHLRTTLIGNSLYRIYKYLGYNTIGINHLGDYGTQFGKMIEGYKLWGNEYNLEEEPINKMVEIYIRINELCKQDEKVLENCRENFRLLENGDEFCTKLWEKFKDLSLREFNRIYDTLDVKFDYFTGEAFYADKTQEIIDILEQKGKITESEGAKIVDLEDVRNTDTMYNSKSKWLINICNKRLSSNSLQSKKL